MAADGGRFGAALVGLLIGALAGAMLALPVANSQRLRHAYPRGLMAVMDQDLRQLRDASSADACDLDALRPRLERLSSLSADSIEAFRAAEDAEFVGLEGKLATRLAQANASSDCASLHTRLEQVEGACEACHRVYR